FIVLLLPFMVCPVISCLVADFTFVNNHGVTVWVRTLGNAGLPAPGGGTVELASGAQITLSADEGWAGRFWCETGCSDGVCDPGPNSLAEFNIGSLDYYDVSLVDGFNVAIQIEPIGESVDPNNPYRCGVAGCTNDLLPGCPDELKEYNGAGELVVCKSACAAYATDEYCCGVIMVHLTRAILILGLLILQRTSRLTVQVLTVTLTMIKQALTPVQQMLTQSPIHKPCSQ
ncbi:hypothetical protein L9F63_020609, partial [Diploptera punctata]